MATRIMATRPYCTECRQVTHGMTVRIELCSRHGAAADLLLALTRIRTKASAAMEHPHGRNVQTLDSIDEIADAAIARALSHGKGRSHGSK
jgi:hypothetical protein